jgi:hypothetical protein
MSEEIFFYNRCRQGFAASQKILAILLGCMMACELAAMDYQQSPPPKESYQSPNANFEFVISMRGTSSQWAANGSIGQLLENVLPPVQRWEAPLPHASRPRTAMVSNLGYVVLFDQWINVLGPHAITVFDVQGKVITSLGFDDIVAASGLSRSAVASSATLGPWMSAEPRLSDDGLSVELKVADKLLSLDLATGALQQLSGD